jgi:hypothetical protein
MLNLGSDAVGRLQCLDLLPRQDFESDRLGRFDVRGEMDGAEGARANLAGGAKAMMRRPLMFRRIEFEIASGAGWRRNAIEIRALLGLGLAEGTAL